MKFKCAIEIDKPIEEVAQCFRSDAHYPACFKDFISKDLISGKVDQKGTRTSLHYKFGNNDLELIETILDNNLPHRFLAEYNCIPMCNTLEATFEELNKKQTRLTLQIHYTRFSGFIPKMLKLIGGRMLKKQSQNFLKLFKEFAEKQQSTFRV